jgi:hypothetical protein
MSESDGKQVPVKRDHRSTDLRAVAFYHSSANAFTDPCSDPDTCGIHHTHADVQPEHPVIRRTVLIGEYLPGWLPIVSA